MKAERQIIFERCTIEYIRRVIGRAPFKFCMGGVAAQMYELVTRKIPQIVWAESGSYFIAY